MAAPSLESIPSLPSYSGTWRTGFPLVPIRAGRRPGRGGPPAFRTTQTPGGMTADTPSLAWHVDVGLPPSFGHCGVCLLNCGWMLANRNQEAALLVHPEPGIFLGDLPAAFAPELFTANRILREEENRAWLEAGGHRVLLMQASDGKRRRFALVVGSADLDILRQVAEKQLAEGRALAAWQAAWREREDWIKNIPEAERSDRLDLAMECLDALVEDPCGSLPHAWLRDPLAETPTYDLNALPFVLPALARFQPARAEALLASLVQTEEGSLPARIGADGSRDPCPAWPLLAQGVAWARAAHREIRVPEGLLPSLRGHLSAYFGAWDAAREKVPAWPDDEQSLTPEITDAGLDLVDLPCLLLAEIEAYLRLGGDGTTFADAHRTLLQRIREDFWSAERGVLFDRVREGGLVKRMTSGSLLPLVWDEAPAAMRKGLFHSLRSPNGLRGDLGIRQWEPWESDPAPPPVRPPLQHLLLESLLRGAPHDVTSLAGSAWSQAFDRFESLDLGFPSDWTATAQPAKAREWDGPTAAFWIRMSPLRERIDLELSRYPAGVRFLERYRKILVGLVAGLFLALPLGLGIYYAKLDTLSMRQQYTAAGYAETLYGMRMYAEAEDRYTQLMAQLPKGRQQAQYHFTRGKARYHQGRWEEALADFQAAVGLDSRGTLPAARWNLAQIQWRLGDTAAAIETLDAFREQFRDLYPALQARVEDAIAILKTNPVPEPTPAQP